MLRSIGNADVNPAGDAGDTSPNISVGGTSTGISPPILLRTFGYSRLVALRSLSLNSQADFIRIKDAINSLQSGRQTVGSQGSSPPTLNSR